MIFWSGLGILVFPITFVVSLLTNIIVVAIFKDQDYYQTHDWPLLVAFWLSGAIMWFLGIYLDSQQTRTLLDKETGEEVQFKPYHSFFFIRMHIWGPILFLVGIASPFIGD